MLNSQLLNLFTHWRFGILVTVLLTCDNVKLRRLSCLISRSTAYPWYWVGGSRMCFKQCLSQSCLSSRPLLVVSCRSGKKNKRNNKHNLNNSNVNDDNQNCFVILDNISSHNNGIAYLNTLCGNRLNKPIHNCKLKLCKLENTREFLVEFLMNL